MTIQELFELGMKRKLPELLDMPPGVHLNLGPGKSQIPGTIGLDLPEWDAETYSLPYFSNSIAGIHAYHFFEHLADPLRMLREVQRVLGRGGVLNCVVPHALGTLAFQDLDHKHFFVLDTWRNHLDNSYYDKNNTGWTLRIHFNAVLGIVERNLGMLTQFVKE